LGSAEARAAIARKPSSRASSSSNCTLQNEQLKQNNYWNAVKGLSGVAAAYDPNGFASNANSGAGTVAELSQANTAAQNSGWFNKFMGGLGQRTRGRLGLVCHEGPIELGRVKKQRRWRFLAERRRRLGL
jgi:hypothetical protein